MKMTGAYWKVVVVVAAVLVAVLPLPADLVERLFSNGIYLGLQPWLTAASNRVPFFLLDLVMAAIAVTAVVVVRRAWRRAPDAGVRRVTRAATNLAVLAAAIHLVFVACWGLNYQRQPITTRLDFDRARVTPESARELLGIAIDRLNQTYTAAHAAPWPLSRDLPDELGPAFVRTVQLVGASRPVTPGVPKPTVLATYFRWAGIDGLTNPFGLDVAVSDELIPAERPFVVAHEWGHLAGVAHEAEANFLAWLTCLHGTPQAQYSGWLSVLGHLAAAVPDRARREQLAALEDGPRKDLAAMVARRQRIRPAIRLVAWYTYDRFLRANRVQEGIASYSLVTELLLGTRIQGERPDTELLDRLQGR